jgi:hypothetical protein
LIKHVGWSGVIVLGAFLAIPCAKAQETGYHKVCIVIHSANTSKSMSVVPEQFTVGECALLAAGYDQGEPKMEGTTYELGCMTDKGGLLATPKNPPEPYTLLANANGSAWERDNRGRQRVEYETCAKIWYAFP